MEAVRTDQVACVEGIVGVVTAVWKEIVVQVGWFVVNVSYECVAYVGYVVEVLCPNRLIL